LQDYLDKQGVLKHKQHPLFKKTIAKTPFKLTVDTQLQLISWKPEKDIAISKD
jgi:hypothetical protein